MKKLIFILFAILSLQINAQTTTANKLKINNPDLGVTTDSVMVWNGSTKLVKYLPFSSYLSLIPDSLPSQTGNSGKWLTTNGTNASWGTLPIDNLNAVLTSGNTSDKNILLSYDVYEAKLQANGTLSLNDLIDNYYTTVNPYGFISTKTSSPLEVVALNTFDGLSIKLDGSGLFNLKTSNLSSSNTFYAEAPNYNGTKTLPISVNGNFADTSGNITLSLSSPVTSVNAQTGAVVLDADNIAETSTRKWVSPTEKTTWNGKQDALVSGTNIKTLESNSLLGSGNIDLTKNDVGLSNVDNTSDVNKPVSTAQQTAIDAKVENNLTASTTVAPSKTAVNTALALKKDLNRKSNILILVGGQSNSGTDPATGQTAYADLPAYLNYTPTNIKTVNIVSSAYALVDWAPPASTNWGWLNQYLYIMSNEYTNVIFSKRAVGGTDILPNRLGLYPRSDFKNKTLYAIAQANSLWGAGNYDVVLLWNQGETNGLTLAGAQAYQAALKEWFLEMRSQVADVPIIYNKMGTLQRQAFPYIVSDIQPAQLNMSLYDFRNKLVTGESDAMWELQDQTGDVSHYNRNGAISLGSNFAEKTFEVLDRTKTNSTAPTLVSATCPQASPQTIVLTYSSALNEGCVPFWQDFIVKVGTTQIRKVNSISISGSTVTLTMSEPYYTTSPMSLTYYRSSKLESAIQDVYGNKVKAFTDFPVTSTANGGTPTYTNRYTSAFASGDVNSWLGFSGGSNAAVLDPVTGSGFVLECTSSDSTPQHYRNSVFTGTAGHRYRIRASLLVPTTYYGSSNIVMNFTLGTSELISNVYSLLRGYVTAGTWVDFEYTYTAIGTGTAFYIQPSGVPIGDKFYVKNVVIDKIN